MVWDLGPFAAVLVPGQTPPPVTKYKETIWNWKIASDMRSWVLTNSKIQKATKACCFWSAKSKSRAHRATKGVSKPSQPPSYSSPGPTPVILLFKEPVHPPSRSELGHLFLVLTPSCSTSPHKALPEFLVGLLINFYWIRVQGPKPVTIPP